MQARSIFKCAVLTVLLVVLAAGVATAQNTPTISFVNYSGESATVKLIGPTGGYIEVPNGASRTVGVRGGAYTIVTRYGAPSNYSYQRGDQFFVSTGTTTRRVHSRLISRDRDHLVLCGRARFSAAGRAVSGWARSRGPVRAVAAGC
jgi:hypothetical protein